MTSAEKEESILTEERLNDVVDNIKRALRDPELRKVSQRAVQGKIWHLEPSVAQLLVELRAQEEAIRQDKILPLISELVYGFHDQTLDATLMRAGIISSEKVHAGSSLTKEHQELTFDLICLDCKERLYVLLKQYGWLEEFFRNFPLHFYENSFAFVNRIPPKKLPLRVKVVGLGIGGSMCCSGLAKAGLQDVQGYEKRPKEGIGSVGSRYQNASWRAYEVAEKLLDDEAYEHLVSYRQQINITYDDGSTGVSTSDRVQIILGSAIEASIASAERYGAQLHFDLSGIEEYFGSNINEKSDLVVLFAGAHTPNLFPGLADQMKIIEWPKSISSLCNMFLKIHPSSHTGFYCSRWGEVGAEHWDYTIHSARNTPTDIVRVRNALTSQYRRAASKMDGTEEKKKEELDESYSRKVKQLEKTLAEVEHDSKRFDYVFTNCPDNTHNREKQEKAESEGTVVLDGQYVVDVKLATRCIVRRGRSSDQQATDLLDKFGTNLVVVGGDACVPPNPQAAYGATLACEAADHIVQMAVGMGHLNAMVELLKQEYGKVEMSPSVAEWIEQLETLQELLSDYFEARSRAENYFQWVQTLICNLYSLPPLS